MKFIINYDNNLYKFNTNSSDNKKVTWLKQKAMRTITSINLAGQKEMILRVGKLSFDDDWNLSTIPYGTILHCHLHNPMVLEGVALKVRLAYNEESVYFSTIDWDNSILDIKLAIQHKIGIPIGVFRLCYEGEELYDVQTLRSLMVPKGSIFVCENWDGWNEFLIAAKQGLTQGLEDIISSDLKVRAYQMQVGLYIAAHLGHTDFAEKMIHGGAKGDRPVGPHPTKRWCLRKKDDSPYYNSIPIHEATARDRLSILVLIVAGIPNSIYVLNNDGDSPLDIATKLDSKKCKRFLEKELIGQKSKANPSSYTARELPTKLTFNPEHKFTYKRSYSLEQHLTCPFSSKLIHVDKLHTSAQNSQGLKRMYSEQQRNGQRLRFKTFPFVYNEYTKNDYKANQLNLHSLSRPIYTSPSKTHSNPNKLLQEVQDMRGQSNNDKARACLSHAKLASNDTYLTQVKLATKLNTRNLLEKIEYSEKMKITII
ncbi:hypothetical protein LOD99_8959 [Oopsacas minuta]|uniref:Ubiquitin-like domain-containing protein n=1 Tax=Oopsacas minuta TaxID=111878 RepID=A0AAV7JE98_9METZ|nr:hypothetical protein LOD99_8959 [Oopsacas minuta]